MTIKNLTGRSIVVALRNVVGYDDREERLEPNECSDVWLRLEEEDIITIEEE